MKSKMNKWIDLLQPHIITNENIDTDYQPSVWLTNLHLNYQNT